MNGQSHDHVRQQVKEIPLTVKNDNLVRRIYVERVSERERDWVVQRAVGRSGVLLDGGLREARYEFLYPTNALCSGYRCTIRRSVPECEVEAVGLKSGFTSSCDDGR